MRLQLSTEKGKFLLELQTLQVQGTAGCAAEFRYPAYLEPMSGSYPHTQADVRPPRTGKLSPLAAAAT
jgi:hypothetical protein